MVHPPQHPDSWWYQSNLIPKYSLYLLLFIGDFWLIPHGSFNQNNIVSRKHNSRNDQILSTSCIKYDSFGSSHMPPWVVSLPPAKSGRPPRQLIKSTSVLCAFLFCFALFQSRFMLFFLFGNDVKFINYSGESRRCLQKPCWPRLPLAGVTYPVLPFYHVHPSLAI